MLTIKDLTVNIGPVAVLRGVTLSVRKGEIVTVLGANGAGKTTLVRTICGQIRPVSGTIVYDGKRIDGVSPQTIGTHGIAQCPEGRQLFGSLTVEENLRLAGSRPGLDWKQCRHRLRDLLNLFPIIQDRWNQQAGSLSGGEQQMVALARAFIVGPRLLLVDELSLGLAPALIDRIFSVLPALLAEGTSILLVEQQARAALRLANRAYVLAHGTVVLEGTALDVRNSIEQGNGYFSPDLTRKPSGQ